jgi:hypothetical protein
MFIRRSRIVPLAVVSLLAASSLAIAACGGDDEESEREASGGTGFVVDGNTGDASKNKTYRGVALEVKNDFGQDIWVSFAGRCDQGRGPGAITGTNGWVKLSWGERARWRACDDLIDGADYGYKNQVSALSWGASNPEDGTIERFTLKNPAVGRPEFLFNDRDCFNRDPAVSIADRGPLGQFSENQIKSTDYIKTNCGAEVIVEREKDGRNYKDFNLWVTQPEAN